MKQFIFNAHDEFGNRKQILQYGYSLVDAMKKAQKHAKDKRLVIIY